MLSNKIFYEQIDEWTLLVDIFDNIFTVSFISKISMFSNILIQYPETPGLNVDVFVSVTLTWQLNFVD